MYYIIQKNITRFVSFVKILRAIKIQTNGLLMVMLIKVSIFRKLLYKSK